MTNAVDITGRIYGKLTVISLHKRDGRRSYWLCQCGCGNSSVKSLDSLRKGTLSCGCFRRGNHFKHGYSKTTTYESWSKMRTRCTNPTVPEFKDYGGRGITVCDRWNKFENFLDDMGERPKGLMLERVDNSKHYSPDNCIWADAYTQANNTRKNRFLVIGGTKRTVAQWARIVGWHPTTIRGWRLNGTAETRVAEELGLVGTT